MLPSGIQEGSERCFLVHFGLPFFGVGGRWLSPKTWYLLGIGLLIENDDLNFHFELKAVVGGKPYDIPIMT